MNFRIVTGALPLAALIAAAGCGGSQPAAPDPSLVAAPPPSTDQPKVRDETTEYVQADVPALHPIHFESTSTRSRATPGSCSRTSPRS